MSFLETLFTLRAKLVILFLILVLAPLATIGIFSIMTTESLVGNLVMRQLENVAADKVIILDRWLEERKKDLQVVAGTSLVQSMDPSVIKPYLELVQTHYEVYDTLTVVSAENKIIFSTQSPVSSVAHCPPVSGAGDPLIISSITYLPRQRESTFRIAVPIFNNGALVGRVIGTVGTHKIITIILQVSLGQTGECYLVDNNGTFLAHKEPRRILTENISQSESFKNIFGGRDREKIYLDYRNVEVLGASRKVGDTDWYLVVEQDREEAFGSMNILKDHVYFTIFLSIGSALILVWVISYHIVRPVRNLSRSARTLAMANFNSEMIQTSRRDEIGVLCRAFVDMAQKIQQRHDFLEEKFNLKAAELKEVDHTLSQFKLIAERSEKFATIGRLGAAVAHEIRTPITSLKLFLESIQDEIEISREYVEDFMVAMDQISRIERAINRLLEYTKPKELDFSQLYIDHLIAGIVSLIRPLANKQECEIKVRVDADLPPMDADKKLLEEAIINLFINSLEAMPKKGGIQVTARMGALGSGKNKVACIRIDISDSGPGILQEDINSIFEPFFTTKSSGTGLGLPMVLNTVKRHHGEIRVKNRENCGAVVSLFLPVKPE